MDGENDKLKKIILFQLNKSIISLAREMIIMMEHANMSKELFNANRKYVFDTCNQTIREISELIEQGL